MFETLARLYDGGAIQKCHLENAVDRGWITQSEKEEIVAAAEKNTPHQWGVFFSRKSGRWLCPSKPISSFRKGGRRNSYFGQIFPFPACFGKTHHSA